MKRKRIFTALLFSLACACAIGLSGCGKVDETVTVEGGEYCDITQWFAEGDNLATAKLTNEKDTTIDLAQGQVLFSQTGEYILTLASGKTVKIVVTDTKGPVLTRTNFSEFYYVGQTYDVGVLCMDKVEGVLTPSSVTVTCGDENVPVADGKFIPAKEGTYKIVCKASDSKGNESEFSYEIEVIAKYEFGSKYNFVIKGATVRNGLQNVGEKSYLKNIVSGEGFADIWLEGNGLAPYAEYTVTANYTVKNYTPASGDYANKPFELFLSKADKKLEDESIIKVGVNPYFHGEACAENESKTITFEVTTNEYGEFIWDYRSFKFNGSMELIWNDVSLEKKGDLNRRQNSFRFGTPEGQDGPFHLMQIEKGISGTEFVNLNLQGDDKTGAGALYETRTLKAQNSGYVQMTMKGAGFQPNTWYTFTISYDWEYSNDAVYAFFTLHDDNLAICTMWGKKTNTSVTYEVKTDAKGGYTAVFKHLSLKQMCRIKWLGVSEEASDFGIHGVDCQITSYNGNYAYKVSSEQTVVTNPDNPALLVWVNGEEQNIMYDVYAKVKHSYSVNSGNWGMQFGQYNYITTDGRQYLGRTTSIDKAKGNLHCFKMVAIRDTLSAGNYALIYDLELVPVTHRAPITIKSDETSDETKVTLDKETLKLTTDAQTSAIKFSVTKTQLTGTEMKTPVLTNVDYGTKFTTESGYFYEIEMTVTGSTEKEYAVVYEQTTTEVLYTFDGANETFTIANDTGVDAGLFTSEYGNYQYKIFNTDGTTYKTCNFQISNKSVSGYKVYADFTVVGEQSGSGLSFNYTSNWTNVKSTQRVCIGTIDAAGAFKQVYVYPRFDGENSYVLIDNIVLQKP